MKKITKDHIEALIMARAMLSYGCPWFCEECQKPCENGKRYKLVEEVIDILLEEGDAE